MSNKFVMMSTNNKPNLCNMQFGKSGSPASFSTFTSNLLLMPGSTSSSSRNYGDYHLYFRDSDITICSRKYSHVSALFWKLKKDHPLVQVNILSIIIFLVLSIQLLCVASSSSTTTQLLVQAGSGATPLLLRSSLAYIFNVQQITFEQKGEQGNKIDKKGKRVGVGERRSNVVVSSPVLLLQSRHFLLSSQSTRETLEFPGRALTAATIIQNENRFTALLSSTLGLFLVVVLQHQLRESCHDDSPTVEENWIQERKWQQDDQITNNFPSTKSCVTNRLHVLHFQKEKWKYRTEVGKIGELSFWNRNNIVVVDRTRKGNTTSSSRLSIIIIIIMLLVSICIPTYNVLLIEMYTCLARILGRCKRLDLFVKRMLTLLSSSSRQIPTPSSSKSKSTSKQLPTITSSFVFALLSLNTIIVRGTMGTSVGSYFIYRRDPFALLTGTLRTYQKASCDGEHMTLRCPMGTTISVQLAQYGKTAPSPALCSTIPNTHSELLDIVEGYANVTCHWPTAIQTVVGLCQKKTSCKFQTSPGTFGGDPCPGSRKYVEVAYKCRPSEFRSVIGCDSEVIQLKCNRSSRLAIYSANYGRTEYESVQCPQPKGVQEESCLSSFATENVMQMCHGKRRCALGVNPATFGTPCKPESKMYLKVIHTCVPRKVLKEKYQGELEPDEMFEDETEYESGDPVGGVLEQPSIYSPDHSKGWVNPKSTVKPSFPSKSRSSLKYRPQVFTNEGGSTTFPTGSSSIVYSSNTLPRYINQQHQQQPNQAKGENQQGQSDFDSRKPFSPSQNGFPKARHNFPQEVGFENGDNDRDIFTRGNHNRGQYHNHERNYHSDSRNRNAAIVAGVGVTSSHNLRNSTGANHSQDDLRLIYLISQGIRAYDFISRNKESLWLYITISIASALLVVILVILVKIWVQRSAGLRGRRTAANLTVASSKPSSSSAGPITSTALSDIDELSVVTDEVTELPSILRRGSPGDELDLQTSSTTHLISNSSNNSASSTSATTTINNPLTSGVMGVSGSPSMLTGMLGGFNSSVVVTDGASVAPGGEGALLLGAGAGGGGGSIVNTSGGSTFITSGSATMGRKPHHHHQQQQQQQQYQQLQHHQQQQQQNSHPSSTFMTMTTYGMPMASTALPGGPHPTYTLQHHHQQQHQQQGGTNPSSSGTSVVANPSTMTLGRAMSSSSRPRDSNIHFYYD